ncbi:MAG: glycosyltransferase [Treponema sp.]|nr:glycosyltransferase [Treponema sp.]
MTVVHVIEPFASGVTTAIISITRELKKVKHIVIHGSRTWVDSEDRVKAKFPPEVRFIPWKRAGREINPLQDGLALAELVSLLRKLKVPDMVVHLHSSKAGFLGRLACRITGIRRVIYTPHGASFLRRDVGPLRRAFFKGLEKLGGCFSGAVVGCGQSEGELYGSRGKPALWVANGVKVEEAPPREKRYFACFAGIANCQKNPALFNAVVEALGEGSGFSGEPVPAGSGGGGRDFVWVGDGALRRELTSPRIKITGWVGPGQVGEYLAESLVYLSTSGWEGLPYGVLEAMGASLALVLTDIPGHRDLVEPGKNGFLFREPEEAAAILRDFAANPGKAPAMGAESRRIVTERFSVERMGEGYRGIYRALLEGGVVIPPGT